MTLSMMTGLQKSGVKSALTLVFTYAWGLKSPAQSIYFQQFIRKQIWWGLKVEGLWILMILQGSETESIWIQIKFQTLSRNFEHIPSSILNIFFPST